MKTETLTKIGFIILTLNILLLGVLIGKRIFQPEPDQKAEKTQLEIQHLQYQVGIDSLVYDREKMFYERRIAK